MSAFALLQDQSAPGCSKTAHGSEGVNVLSSNVPLDGITRPVHGAYSCSKQTIGPFTDPFDTQFLRDLGMAFAFPMV